MELWQKTCLLLCCYGFFKEMRPSEPFLTEYLLGPVHNLTEEEVYYEIFPVWTYSYLSQLILVLLITDLLRYKPVIVLEAVAYIATWCLLLWARGVQWLQVTEFMFGVTTSTEVAYYTYIYAQVDGKHYQKVSSYTRTALLTGRFTAGMLAQVLYSTHLMDAHNLNYISLASFFVAIVFAVALPTVHTSVYFHRDDAAAQEATLHGSGNNQHVQQCSENELSGKTQPSDGKTISPCSGCVKECGTPQPTGGRTEAKQLSETAHDETMPDTNRRKCEKRQTKRDANEEGVLETLTSSVGYGAIDEENLLSSNGVHTVKTTLPIIEKYSLMYFKQIGQLLWTDFTEAYTNTHLVKWSIWWAVATCGCFQTLNYIQALWESQSRGTFSLYNGVVEAISTLLGAGASLSVAYLKVDWSVAGEAVLAGVSLLEAAVLIFMGFTNNLILSYLCYVLFRASYEFLITIASFQVAKELKSDSYGFVFGLNMFLSLLLQALLTLVVVDLLHTPIGIQFMIYGTCFGVLSFFFFVLFCVGALRRLGPEEH